MRVTNRKTGAFVEDCCYEDGINEGYSRLIEGDQVTEKVVDGASEQEEIQDEIDNLELAEI